MPKLIRASIYDYYRHGTRHGTCWVEPGQGSTWRELLRAFEPSAPIRTYRPLKRSTNLLLTGNALTEQDRERWESGNVK